jgi:YD repeat-containing protein
MFRPAWGLIVLCLHLMNARAALAPVIPASGPDLPAVFTEPLVPTDAHPGRMGETGSARWLEVTDPIGQWERLEFRHDAAGFPSADSAAPVGFMNGHLDRRNTYDWDKHAMAHAPGDYRKARITHFLHSAAGLAKLSSLPESTKEPLENRIWRSYGGASTIVEGPSPQPLVEARRLDDGTEQRRTWAFDPWGRVVQQTDPVGRRLTFTYAQGRLAERETRGAREYRCYGPGGLTAIGNPLGAFAFDYEPGTGRPARIAYPNGQVTTYGYSGAGQGGRLERIRNLKADGSNLSTFDYTYDSGGQVRTWGRTLEAAEPVVAAYRQDAAGQLLEATLTEPGTQKVLRTYGYGYDGAGNRITEQINGAITSSRYNELNQLIGQAFSASPSLRSSTSPRLSRWRADSTPPGPADPGLANAVPARSGNPGTGGPMLLVPESPSVLDIGGTYYYDYATNVRIFQEGSRIHGYWWHNFNGFPARTFSGTLEGTVARGTWTATNGSSSGAFVFTFVPGRSPLPIQGTWGTGAASTGHSFASHRKSEVSTELLPLSRILRCGETTKFAGLVAGSPNRAMSWSCSGGTVLPDGTYTAPSFPGVFTVGFASAADPKQHPTAVVSVSADGILDVSGTFYYGYASNVRVFQDGNRIHGTWWHNFKGFPSRTFAGALDGTVVRGTWDNADGPGSGGFEFAFRPGVIPMHMAGTWGEGTARTGNSLEADRTREITGELSPQNPSLRVGESLSFKSLVAGSSNKAVTWSCSGGTIDPEGLYTAPLAPNLYTVSFACAADPSRKPSTVVSVTNDGLFDVTGHYLFTYAGNIRLVQDGSRVLGDWWQNFKAWPARTFLGNLRGRMVAGAWTTQDGQAHGTFQFTLAPDKSTLQAHWTTRGKPAPESLVACRHKQVEVLVAPVKADLDPGESMPFIGHVIGTFNKRLAWAVTGPATVTQGGIVTAPEQVGTYTVTAASLADKAAKATASVQVAIRVQVSPANVTLPPGATCAFRATTPHPGGVRERSTSWPGRSGIGGAWPRPRSGSAPRLPSAWPSHRGMWSWKRVAGSPSWRSPTGMAVRRYSGPAPTEPSTRLACTRRRPILAPLPSPLPVSPIRRCAPKQPCWSPVARRPRTGNTT